LLNQTSLAKVYVPEQKLSLLADEKPGTMQIS